MNRRELIDFCLTLPFASEEYPFDDVVDAAAWTAMRHSANQKCFAFITERSGRLLVNLKCDPLEADFLRQAFADVTPGYHMNKEHWNTVYIGGDVPDKDVMRMIEKSYDLVKPKLRKRRILDE